MRLRAATSDGPPRAVTGGHGRRRVRSLDGVMGFALVLVLLVLMLVLFVAVALTVAARACARDRARVRALIVAPRRLSNLHRDSR